MKARAWRPRPMDDVEILAIARQAVGEDFEIVFARTALRPARLVACAESSRIGIFQCGNAAVRSTPVPCII